MLQVALFAIHTRAQIKALCENIKVIVPLEAHLSFENFFNHFWSITMQSKIEDNTSVTQTVSSSSENDVMHRLIQTYLKNSQLPPPRQAALEQFFLLFLSVVAPFNYYLPAKAYAESDDSYLILRNPAHSTIATCTAAGVVLYNSTDIFARWLASQNIPKELQDILKLEGTAFRRRLKHAGISIASFLSSLPLTSSYVAYQKDPVAQEVALALLIQLSNTVLHFLPFHLMFSDPFYRLPVRPIEIAFKRLRDRGMTEGDKVLRRLRQERSQSIETLKRTLMARLMQGSSVCLREAFSRIDWCRLKYRIGETNSIQDLTSSQVSPQDTLSSVLCRAPDRVLVKTPFQKRLDQINFWLGSMWVFLSCAGYLANGFNALNGEIGEPLISVLLIALPIYAFSVLLVFFGGNFLPSNVNTVKSILKGEYECPLEVKLYPKSFLLLEFFNLYVALFSYAAAVEVVNDNFPEYWGRLRGFLGMMALSGISYLGLNSVHDFFKLMANKFAMYITNDKDARLLVRFQAQMTQLVEKVGQIDQEAFFQMANQLSEADFHRYFQSNKNSLLSKIPRRSHQSFESDSKVSRCSRNPFSSSFFKERNNIPGQQAPLLADREAASYASCQQTGL